MVKTSCSQFRGHELGPQLRNMLQGMTKRKKKNKIYIYVHIMYISKPSPSRRWSMIPPPHNVRCAE